MTMTPRSGFSARDPISGDTSPCPSPPSPAPVRGSQTETASISYPHAAPVLSQRPDVDSLRSHPNPVLSRRPNHNTLNPRSPPVLSQRLDFTEAFSLADPLNASPHSILVLGQRLDHYISAQPPSILSQRPNLNTLPPRQPPVLSRRLDLTEPVSLHDPPNSSARPPPVFSLRPDIGTLHHLQLPVLGSRPDLNPIGPRSPPVLSQRPDLNTSRPRRTAAATPGTAIANEKLTSFPAKRRQETEPDSDRQGEPARRPLGTLSVNVNTAKRSRGERVPVAARAAATVPATPTAIPAATPVAPKADKGSTSRRSFRLVDVPQKSYAETLALSDEEGVGNAGEEGGDKNEHSGRPWADLLYDNELESVGLDDEDDEDEPSPPADPDTFTGAAALTATPTAVVDENGFIRVGPQPVKDSPFVRNAPAEVARSVVRRQLTMNLRLTNSKFSTDEQALRRQEEQLEEYLKGLFVVHATSRISVVCDYSAYDMSWAPGPFKLSLEAIYPFVVSNGNVLYHAPPNVSYLMAALNWLKGKQSILVLALLGLWLRIKEEPDFQRRKALWTWTFNALTNVAILAKIFSCNLSHVDQVKRWKSWDQDKQRAVLEHLRTGTFGPVIQAELEEWVLPDLLSLSGNRWQRVPKAPQVDWEAINLKLLDIASMHGLTPDEFDEYCMLEGVFFPFHISSRRLAQQMGWSRDHLHFVLRTKLERMRKECNKNAEAAGRGEKQMDPIRVIYWWCHRLCQQIRELKQQRPTATREEIAFHILDRRGLPVTPWACSATKASLCKDQDHGIAMLFGLKDGDFDPVTGFDFARCTVRIDSKATNMAMRNFPTGSWDRIRQVLASVPLSHPFWRVDDDLGRKPWVGSQDNEVEAAPPTRPFEIPLVPIDPWLDSGVPLPPFQCAECPNAPRFHTAGLLVRHYQEHHNREAGVSFAADPAQDDADNGFWEEALSERRKHLDTAHKGKTYPCTEPGCSRVFFSHGGLTDHLNTAHKGTKYLCPEPGCFRGFASRRGLADHHDTAHKGKNYPCIEPGCSRVFTSRRGLADHHNSAHKGINFPCEEPDCSMVFATRGARRVHAKNKHKK